MADIKKVKVSYQPKGENKPKWEKSVPEEQAKKMVKLGRWKYTSESQKPEIKK